MRTSLHGSLPRPAVAIVGVWDPFLASHRDLLERLHAHAVESSCSSLGVLIDPSPGTVSSFTPRYGVSGWPVYDSVAARIRFMLDCGLDAVLCMHFVKRDFRATAADFLDAVRTRVQLEELWLGALQLLGPGQRGSRAAVAEYAALHGMRLTILPPPPLAIYDLRSFLAAGQLVDAIAVVGHPPMRERPRSGELRLAWRPGRYRAIALGRPGSIEDGTEIDVALTPCPTGPAKLSWPCRSVRYLAFTFGPRDRQSADRSLECHPTQSEATMLSLG
jgi:FAD synthetase